MTQKTTNSPLAIGTADDVKNFEKTLRGLDAIGTNAFRKISAELAFLNTNIDNPPFLSN